VSIEVVPLPDTELERLANEDGAFSVSAMLLEQLRESRAKDRQVYAFRVGAYYFVGPVPDARTESALIDLAEADEEE
jgi:hypothetical protein